MDEPELHSNEEFGVNPKSPLFRALQGAADGHGPIVFQLECFGRKR